MQDQPIPASPRATYTGSFAVMMTLRVLERLARDPGSVPEVSRTIGRGDRSTRRTMYRLRTENYVVQDGGRSRRYRPTMRLAALGVEVLRRAPLPRLAQPVLAQLAAGTGGRAHLWIAGPADPIDIAGSVVVDEADGRPSRRPGPSSTRLGTTCGAFRSSAMPTDGP